MRYSVVYPWTLNVATRGVLTHLENTKNHFRPGPARDPAGGAYDAPPDPLVGWGGDTPSPFPTASTPPASRPRSRVPLYLFGGHPKRIFLQAMRLQTWSSDENSVRPSVCLSVKRVLCDKTVSKLGPRPPTS